MFSMGVSNCIYDLVTPFQACAFGEIGQKEGLEVYKKNPICCGNFTFIARRLNMNFDFGSLLGKMQDMQKNMEKAKEELADVEMVGEAGAGLVKVRMSGLKKINGIDIDDSLIGAGADKEMLTDLISAAFNSALQKIDDQVQSQMGSMGKEFNLPDGFKLPF